MLSSLLKLAKLVWPVPDYITLSRRQKDLEVVILYRQASGGLNLLVDSTGMNRLGECEWNTMKQGADYRRQWRKVNCGIDPETLEIRVIEISSNAVSDAPMRESLLAQIPPTEALATVTTDGANDTKAFHAVVARRGATAIIPPHKNGKPWKDDKLDPSVLNEILPAVGDLGRKLWKKWSCYLRLTLVETKFRCFRLLDERVKARDFGREVAELQIRAVLLNRFTQLGTPLTVRIA